ncbi:hypothetical protein QVD17_24755 [Tagetes erecta]|uniref:Uncharacterized protein n=1 Tax=Tagetes erecta TaxID=13708 RepID=A0AAD8KFY7_TARER|nr:hypothetical protein QVD17_24755 [Tagetes erecta]
MKIDEMMKVEACHATVLTIETCNNITLARNTNHHHHLHQSPGKCEAAKGGVGLEFYRSAPRSRYRFAPLPPATTPASSPPVPATTPVSSPPAPVPVSTNLATRGLQLDSMLCHLCTAKDQEADHLFRR